VLGDSTSSVYFVKISVFTFILNSVTCVDDWEAELGSIDRVKQQRRGRSVSVPSG